MVAEMMLNALQLEQHNRLMAIQRAWAAYYGRMPKPLQSKPGEPDDNVRINLASLIVDTGVSYLFGDDLAMHVDGNAESEETRWLTACWVQNRKMTRLSQLGINGGVTGDVYVRVKIEPHLQYPRLIVLDPETVTPACDVDDYEKVLEFIVQWSGKDPARRQMVARRQVFTAEGDPPVRWMILDQESVGNSANWVTIGQEVWPHTWAPIFHCQNLPAPNCYHGVPDIGEDTMEVMAGINFVVSDIRRILRFHGHPRTWGSGFNAKDLAVGPDKTLVFGNPDAKLQNLEMQSDLGASIEYLKQLKEALHEMAQLPEVAIGKMDGIGALSGVALQILYRPIVDRTKKKQLLYGDMLVDLNQRLLELAGRGDAHEVENHWPNPIPVDAKEEAETGVVLQDLGVSKSTVLTRLGYDAEAEAEQRAKEATAQEELGDALLRRYERGQDGQPQDGNEDANKGDA